MMSRSSWLSVAWTLCAGSAWVGLAIAAPAPSAHFAQQNSGITEVDVELALAVDI